MFGLEGGVAIDGNVRARFQYGGVGGGILRETEGDIEVGGIVQARLHLIVQTIAVTCGDVVVVVPRQIPYFCYCDR